MKDNWYKLYTKSNGETLAYIFGETLAESYNLKALQGKAQIEKVPGPNKLEHTLISHKNQEIGRFKHKTHAVKIQHEYYPKGHIAPIV